MQRLLEFLLKYRTFFIFIFLELVCGWLIVEYNHYQNKAYLHSASSFTGFFLNTSGNITDYFRLKKVNKKLATENAELSRRLQQLTGEDTIPKPSLPKDSTGKIWYEAAKVINNSVDRYQNFLTLNKGRKDSISPGMGVISTNGVVGKVKACSRHFSTVISLLHADMTVSSKIDRQDILCTAKWDAQNPREATLLYVPRHVHLNKGDTIVTSGYNSVFPEDIMIGTIKSYKIEKGETFYTIRVKLATDFRSLSYVYVVRNPMRQEKDSLETKTFEY